MTTTKEYRKRLSEYTKSHPEANRKKARKYQAKMHLQNRCYKCGKSVWREGADRCEFHRQWASAYLRKRHLILSEQKV